MSGSFPAILYMVIYKKLILSNFKKKNSDLTQLSFPRGFQKFLMKTGVQNAEIPQTISLVIISGQNWSNNR